MVCKHLPEVTCQCDTDPFAFTASKTFLVFEAPIGLKRRPVTGIDSLTLLLRNSYASLPFEELYTLIVPSPQPAARSFPSGENLVEKTSLGLSLTVYNGIKRFVDIVLGAKSANDTQILGILTAD
mmetsp:Transcript_38918/g.62679  ORF Transcript_38918/g.62679 Transcript_38918/m.62679 type:complete len:125 (-) Transcript_38918:101-475(-)